MKLPMAKLASSGSSRSDEREAAGDLDSAQSQPLPRRTEHSAARFPWP